MLQFATLTVSASVVVGRMSSLRSLDVPVCLSLLYKNAYKILFHYVPDVYNLKERGNRRCALKKK